MTDHPEWDGFADPFWNLGQLILWVATRNRDCVDAASDCSGRYDGSYGLAAAAVQIEKHVPTEARERLIAEVRQKALDGALKGYDYSLTPPEELPPVTWTKLKIVFDSDVPCIRWHHQWDIVPAHDLRFSKKNVLQCFPASKRSKSYWVLPESPPQQKAPNVAYVVLKRLFSSGQIPKKYTAERLAQMASARAKKTDPHSKPITRDTILRVFGQKK